METKTCNRCGETKPATSEYFYRNRSSQDGLQHRCKQCVYTPLRKQKSFPSDRRGCSRCKEIKPLENFGKDARRKDGCRSECKQCRSKADVARHGNPEVRQRIRNYARKRNLENGVRTYKPRRGHIYIIQCDRFFKIGRSINAEKRFRQISAFLPFEIKMIHRIESDDIAEAEIRLHDRFSHKRSTGEWFELSKDDVNALFSIKEIIFRK